MPYGRDAQGRRDETERARADNAAGRGAFGTLSRKSAWRRPEMPDHPAQNVQRQREAVRYGAPTSTRRGHAGRISGVTFPAPHVGAAELLQYGFGRAAIKPAAARLIWHAAPPRCQSAGPACPSAQTLESANTPPVARRPLLVEAPSGTGTSMRDSYRTEARAGPTWRRCGRVTPPP